MTETTDIETVQLTEDGGYVVNGHRHVPADPGNRHFRAVQDWIKDGGEPAPFVTINPDYKDLRRIAYPAIGDQLDALWKQLDHMKTQGADLASDADATLDLILAVKAKHPKN